MRRFLSWSLPLLALSALIVAKAPGAADKTARTATKEEVSLLNDALHKIAADLRRWAYTEHQVFRDHKGKVKNDVVVRFDPSKPYAEQWTPLQINGKEPSPRDREKYRKRGERSAPRDQQVVKPDAVRGGRSGERVSLGEVLDLARCTIAAETPTHLVFEIPLLKVGNERFPPEKFQVHARLRKEGGLLENIAVKLRDSFRAKLVVKVKSGEGSIDFAQPDPKHPPTMVAVRGDAMASVLFVSIGGALELKRTELKHVKPFDEQFEVQIGTLKAIDF